MKSINADYIKSYFFVRNNNIIEFELYYFKLMASMRKFRMNIPDFLTMNFLEQEINKLLIQNNSANSRIEIVCLREYKNIKIIFNHKNFDYSINKKSKFEIEVFKDFNLLTNILSTINYYKPEFEIAKIYSKENDLDDVIFLNENKRVSRTINGDLFFIENNSLNFNSISEGNIQTILSIQVKNKFKNKGFNLNETSFSPFEIQKANEVFIISEKKGIIPISKIRKKEFNSDILISVLEDLYI